MAFLDYDGLKYFKEKNDAAYVKVYNNAGAHNAIYRGEKLGTAVTDAQYAAIKAGTFEDLYIGDYWVINNVTWRIAAFDYYYNRDYPFCTTHHVTIVPDTILDKAVINSTGTVEGAYYGSEMYTTNLATAKTTINTAFGSAHILTYSARLTNAVDDAGAAAGVSWYDSTVELMTEINVFGTKIISAVEMNTLNRMEGATTSDMAQFPLFALAPEKIRDSGRTGYWLRDLAFDKRFCYVSTYGACGYYNVKNSNGVRPAFSIIG